MGDHSRSVKPRGSPRPVRPRVSAHARYWGQVITVALVLGAICTIGATSQPSRSGALSGRSAVYPPHGQNTRFGHARHSTRFPCAKCHGDISSSTHSAQDHIPRMEQCGECHPRADDTADPTACGHCHSGYQPLWPPSDGLFSVRDPRFPLLGPEASIPFRPNLVFAHSTHGETECAHCHDTAVNGAASLPAEAVCLHCHQREGTQLACAGCHPNREDGRIETSFPGNAQLQPQQLRPTNHDAGWDYAHAASAGADPSSCFACHRESDCLSCHQPVLGIDTIHPPGFRTHHSMDARRQSTSCAACHEPSSFCVDCHIDAGVHDVSQTGSLLGGRFHGSGWVESNGGEHGTVAQHDLLECASCHQESTCAQCHVDVNPHGSGFLSRCGELLEVDPGMCRRCHGAPEIEWLRSLCR